MTKFSITGVQYARFGLLCGDLVAAGYEVRCVRKGLLMEDDRAILALGEIYRPGNDVCIGYLHIAEDTPDHLLGVVVDPGAQTEEILTICAQMSTNHGPLVRILDRVAGAA